MRINIASKEILAKILERKKRDVSSEDVDLSAMLGEILKWANRFVPSQSGSILLDDPTLNHRKEKRGYLYFVACFGKGSSSLVDTSLPVTVGVVGKTYTSGNAYISRKAAEDTLFYPAIDKKTKFHTRSIICAPIEIKDVTIGVIELLNRQGMINYDDRDLTLLKIFAEYTSTLIQNSLDAKRFAELSIRDNLTGLHNDRHFYDILSKTISRSLRYKRDVSLLFMDLDYFKTINDTYGHLAGSSVLTELGQMITDKLHGTGAIASRYGGDEFVIIFPDTDITRDNHRKRRHRLTEVQCPERRKRQEDKRPAHQAGRYRDVHRQRNRQKQGSKGRRR
jgi:diguanylate cyclase (GGDEF)-like protein